jgi:hypothetical protein
MIIDRLEISSDKSFENNNSDYLLFNIYFENYIENSEMNIYADNLLIFSIRNPISKITTGYALPLFKCKHIHITINNNSCVLTNYVTVKNEFEWITNNFSKSKSKQIYSYLDKVIVMMSDDRGNKWLKKSLESIKANVNLKDINLAIVNLNNSKKVRQICKDNDAIEIHVNAETDRMMLCKGALYSIGNKLLAEKYLFIDIDTIVLDDISILLSKIDINSGINICQEGGNHGKKDLRNLLSDNQTPYFSSNQDCKELVPYITNQTAINAGIYSGDRKSILQLESKIVQMEYIGLRYIESKKGIDWREQAVFNVALSHNNNFNIIPEYFNFQMLNTKNKSISELKEYIKNNNIRVLHFNGDYGKELYEKFQDLEFKPRNSFKTDVFEISDRLNFDKKYSISQIDKILNQRVFNKEKILMIDTKVIPSFINYKEKFIIVESYEEQEVENFISTSNIFLKIKTSFFEKFDLVFIHNNRERRNTKIIVNLAKNLLKNDGILVIESEDIKEKIIEKNDMEFNFMNKRYEVKFGN